MALKKKKKKSHFGLRVRAIRWEKEKKKKKRRRKEEEGRRKKRRDETSLCLEHLYGILVWKKCMEWYGIDV